MSFSKLKVQVQAQFQKLCGSGSPLFYVSIDRDKVWEKYLYGFEDPVERQGHNCSCCKSFLRQYAGIVAIANNKVHTLWDIEADEPFTKSVNNLRKYILSLPITDIFVNEFAKCGTDKNADSKRDIVWQHFYIELPKAYVHKSTTTIDSHRGNARDNYSVWKRSLETLTMDSVETVLELIAQNSLYRGKESETLLGELHNMQKAYKKVPTVLRDNFCWLTSTQIHQGLARVRNTAIGTLLVDLSKGTDLDTAVTAFEKMVAPTNYKRPTALVTPRMVDDAKQILNDLGYLDALERRFATAIDITVDNCLFVDRSSSISNVFDDIKKDSAVNAKTLAKVEEISAGDFIGMLPRLKSVEVLLENSHLNNMVTLLTAVNGGPTMFKWNNPFSWAYTGGITDSIKERVKAAGGRIDGELRVSLSWSNYDDLDLHVYEPDNNPIYYGDKKSHYTLGELDVDMNAGTGKSRNPVENIVWPVANKMQAGKYKVYVHNFCRRETDGQGFTVQIECRGEVFDLEFPKNPRNDDRQRIVEFTYSPKTGITMPKEIQSTVADKEKWNLKTNRFHKVKNIMLSPNCEGERVVGNKHLFFILENCASDEQTRPFFNEFLKEELTPHRKFFEILGSRLLVSPTTHQMAGLGFSETQRNHVIVRAQGQFSRLLKIHF